MEYWGVTSEEFRRARNFNLVFFDVTHCLEKRDSRAAITHATVVVRAAGIFGLLIATRVAPPCFLARFGV